MVHFSTLNKDCLNLESTRQREREREREGEVCVQASGQAPHSKSRKKKKWVCAAAVAQTVSTVVTHQEFKAPTGLQGPRSSWSKVTTCV